MLTNNFVRRQTRCALIQNSNDLFFGEVLALHIDLSHFNFMGKISFATVKFSGDRSLGTLDVNCARAFLSFANFKLDRLAVR